MKIIVSIITVIFISSLFMSCSKVKKELFEPTDVSVHQQGITVDSSANFHGKMIKASKWDMKLCKTCHGGSFSGGPVDESCKKCHQNPGGPLACNTCHGDFTNPDRFAPPKDLNGNKTSTARGVGGHSKHLYENVFAKTVQCSECHYVPAYFDDPKHIDQTSLNRAELEFGSLANYRTAGTDTTKKSVYNQTATTCANTYCHGYFKNGNTTNIPKWTDGVNGAKCGSCHGNVTTGKPVPNGTHFQFTGTENCQMCHTDEIKYENNVYTFTDKTKHINGKTDVIGGQLACNTCHGSSTNPDRFAPPKDLSGNTSNSSRGVGAHVKHLYENGYSKTVQCNECHYVPTDYKDPKHIKTGSSNRADLIFGSLANFRPAGTDTTQKAVYDLNTNTCSNTYCHGYFKNGNLTNVAKWTDGSDGAKCGSCHGNVTTGKPVPGGTHINFPGVENCQTCHALVVKYENNAYIFVDKSKHSNGKIDFNN